MKGQRGQALTEMALLAPLFAGLLLLFALWAQLALTRLALIQLTRDAAVAIASDGDLWTDDEAAQERRVRDLARQYPLLEAANLSYHFDPLPLPLGLNLGNGTFGKLFAGGKVRLNYTAHPGGLLGRAFPNGLSLEEWVAVQGDPWRQPELKLFKLFIKG